MEGRFSKQNYFVKFTNPSHAIINGALPKKITNELCFLNRPQRSELACRESEKMSFWKGKTKDQKAGANIFADLTPKELTPIPCSTNRSPML